MTADILAGIADVGLIGVIVYLITVHKKLVITVKNGGTMEHDQWHPEEPIREVPPERQTHTPIDQEGRYHDGTSESVDSQPELSREEHERG